MCAHVCASAYVLCQYVWLFVSACMAASVGVCYAHYAGNWRSKTCMHACTWQKSWPGKE